jgi:ribosomal protein S18 acetylase RimI-like enzyme
VDGLRHHNRTTLISGRKSQRVLWHVVGGKTVIYRAGAQISKTPSIVNRDSFAVVYKYRRVAGEPHSTCRIFMAGTESDLRRQGGGPALLAL